MQANHVLRLRLESGTSLNIALAVLFEDRTVYFDFAVLSTPIVFPRTISTKGNNDNWITKSTCADGLDVKHWEWIVHPRVLAYSTHWAMRFHLTLMSFASSTTWTLRTQRHSYRTKGCEGTFEDQAPIVPLFGGRIVHVLHQKGHHVDVDVLWERFCFCWSYRPPPCQYFVTVRQYENNKRNPYSTAASVNKNALPVHC